MNRKNERRACEVAPSSWPGGFALRLMKTLTIVLRLVCLMLLPGPFARAHVPFPPSGTPLVIPLGQESSFYIVADVVEENATAYNFVSNSDGTVEQSLADAGLRSYLTHVVDSALAGYEKPDPRIFIHALAQAGAIAERTLHIGDLYHADVVGARGAGLHALLLDPYDDWPDLDCPVARHLPEVADAMAATRR